LTLLRRAYITLKAQEEKLEKSNQDIIEMLGTIVEFRNLESGEHVHRVKGYTRILAEKFSELYPEYGLDKNMIDIIVAEYYYLKCLEVIYE
jgi:putative two-component system response regulator